MIDYLTHVGTYVGIYAAVRFVTWLWINYHAWRRYVVRNELALAESGMKPGGSMTFRRFLRDPLSRMVYGGA